MKRNDVGLVLSACLLLSGQLKQLPPFTSVPADLTVVLLVLALGAGIVEMVHSRILPPYRHVLLWSIVLVMAVAGAINTPPDLYPELKTQRAILLTVPVLAAVAINVRSYRNYLRFLTILIGVAGYISVSLLAAGSVTNTGRLSSSGGGTIAFARAAGMVLVGAVAWWLSSAKPGFKRVALVLAVIGFELFVMISIGSRGPVQALVLAVIAMLSVQISQLSRRTISRILLLGSSVAIVAVAAWSAAPDFARRRVGGLWTGEFGGREGGGRTEYYRWTLDNLPVDPFGNGWGAWRALAGFERNHTHNVFLEVWFEAGLIGLVCLSIVVYRVFSTQIRNIPKDRPGSTLALGVLVYLVGGALVSGDINDNRAMFAVLTVSGLAYAADAVLTKAPSPSFSMLGPQYGTANSELVASGSPRKRPNRAQWSGPPLFPQKQATPRNPLFPSSMEAPKQNKEALFQTSVEAPKQNRRALFQTSVEAPKRDNRAIFQASAKAPTQNGSGFFQNKQDRSDTKKQIKEEVSKK